MAWPRPKFCCLRQQLLGNGWHRRQRPSGEDGEARPSATRQERSEPRRPPQERFHQISPCREGRCSFTASIRSPPGPSHYGFTTDHWDSPLDVCGGRQIRRTDFRPSASAFRSLGCAAIDLPAGELSSSQLPTLPASVSVRRFLLVRRRNTTLVCGSTLPSVGETLDPQRPHLFTHTWSYTIATAPNRLIPHTVPSLPCFIVSYGKCKFPDKCR